MALRNWWIRATVDGRNSDLTGGPRAKDGGFMLTISQRDNGSEIRPVSVSGHVSRDGSELILRVFVNGDEHEFRTKR